MVGEMHIYLIHLSTNLYLFIPYLRVASEDVVLFDMLLSCGRKG